MYQSRREAFLAKLPLNSVALFPSSEEVVRSRDTHYPFRQDSDLFYLTGFLEPESLLILSKAATGETRHLLLCRPKNELAEVWEGRRYGPLAAKEAFGIETGCIDALESELITALNQKETLVFASGTYAAFDARVHTCLQTLRLYPKRGYVAPTVQLDARPLIAQLRLFKDEAEQAVMRKACEISASGHVRAMQAAKPGMYEYQLEAELVYEFSKQGARFVGYNSIVGGGENGCILHYTDNASRIAQGDLVLIDAGAEYQGYTGDITRTFPISGQFSEEQRAIYQLVLDALYAACAQVVPGKTMNDALSAACRVLTEGLVQLGILKGELEELLQKNACKQYFIHGLGHWLGLDVHDVGAYQLEGAARPFAPGMVLTIEPGLYIPKGSPCDEKWWGLAVRIEDNLLVTDAGHDNLTSAVPKEIADIEALMAG